MDYRDWDVNRAAANRYYAASRYFAEAAAQEARRRGMTNIAEILRNGQKNEEPVRKPKYAKIATKGLHDRVLFYGTGAHQQVQARLDGKETVIPYQRLTPHLFPQSDDVSSFGEGSMVLPLGTIHVERLGRVHLMVHQQEPKLVNVEWDTTYFRSSLQHRQFRRAANGHEVVKVAISIPYVISIVGCVDGAFQFAEVYFRNAPVNDFNSRISVAPLLNIRDTLTVCTGQNAIRANIPRSINRRTTDDYALGVLRGFTQSFWTTSFNKDITHWYECAREQIREIAWIDEWERNSLIDPDFINDIDWGCYGGVYTISDRLSYWRDQYRGYDTNVGEKSVPSIPDLVRKVERFGRIERGSDFD